MVMGPIESDGSIAVDFNQDMLAPETINQKVY